MPRGPFSVPSDFSRSGDGISDHLPALWADTRGTISMSDLQLTSRQAPVTEARLAGLAYLAIIFAGIFTEVVVRSAVFAPGDPGATIANILGAEQLYRIGFVADLLLLACDVIVAVFLFRILRPAGTSLALLAAAFRLVMAAMLGVNAMNHLAPLTLMQNTEGLTALTTPYLQNLGYLSLRAHGALYAAGLVYFGMACALIGVSILRSTFLPRFLGVLMLIAGFCYLVNSFAGFLLPSFASMLFPYILLPSLLAELSLSIWLLIRGINRDRWVAQARSAA